MIAKDGARVGGLPLHSERFHFSVTGDKEPRERQKAKSRRGVCITAVPAFTQI